MKLALLLPGYLESPDYSHLVVLDEHISAIGYEVRRVDPCDLWATGDVKSYTLTNYIKQIKDEIDNLDTNDLDEVILIGHSLGASAAILESVTDSRVTKVVCLSPAVVLDKSREKWDEHGVRCSKKDLPNDPTAFREFCIPISHLDDRKKYSIPKALKQLEIPVLFLYGADDPTASDIERVGRDANVTKIVKIDNMNHDFRQSVDLCNLVADEVKKFLLD